MKREQRTMDNKGFSLVELIIVIAIMAILIAVLAPQYIKYVERSRKSTDVSNVAEIVTAIQTWGAETNSTLKLYTTDDTGTTFTVGTNGVGAPSGTNADAVKAALENALGSTYATDVKLKSKQWNTSDATNGAVTLTVKVDANLNVTVAQTGPTPTTTLDIVKGLYE